MRKISFISYGADFRSPILYRPEKHGKISYLGLRSLFDALFSMKGKSRKERKKVQKAPRALILGSFP